MNLETGTPIHDGRYIVYVEGVMGWLEPHIVTWATKWKFLHSQQDYPDPVYCWIGPLPVISKAAFESSGKGQAELPEYDL